jgi:hypothetical protein
MSYEDQARFYKDLVAEIYAQEQENQIAEELEYADEIDNADNRTYAVAIDGETQGAGGSCTLGDSNGMARSVCDPSNSSCLLRVFAEEDNSSCL